MRYYKKIVTLAFLFFIYNPGLYSCTCAGIPTFCESVQVSGLVLELEVTDKYNNADGHAFLDFKVKEEILNIPNVNYTKKLSYVEYGTSCDIFLTLSLKKGDKIVVTFSNVEEVEGANFPVIQLYFCSVQHLILKNGKVEGAINELGTELNVMSYSSFKKNIDDLCSVDYLTNGKVNLIRNLTDNYFIIESRFFEDLDFQILDSAGKIALTGKLLAEEIKEVNIKDFPAGMYIIRFNNEISQIVKKVIKV